MRFYKVEAIRSEIKMPQGAGAVEGQGEARDDCESEAPRPLRSRIRDRNDERALCRSTAEVTDRVNAKLKSEAWMALASASDERLVFVVVVSASVNPSHLVTDYCKKAKLPIDATTVEEITFARCRNLVRIAYRNDNIGDDDDVWEDLGLSELIRCVCTEFEHSIIQGLKKRTVKARAAKLLASSGLSEELDRIYTGHGLTAMEGHPVHYLITTDDDVTRDEACTLLTTALYANKRLGSKRVCTIDLAEHCASYDEVEALYLMSETGAVINHLGELDEDSDRQRDRLQSNVLDACKIASKYKDRVLTVFCLPSNCANLKKMIFESMPHTSFVEIKENAADTERARAFLATLAKEEGVAADEPLMNTVDDGESYNTAELRSLYEKWHAKKLRTEAYPQYAAITAADVAHTKDGAKGDAYQELMEMIGLADAKKVINQFLDYRKMRKYLEGLEINRESMPSHMVFTGAPGTAKTTVARLLARIMHDNELLPSGHLVEAGRADLVGQFVGSTAPRVKNCFKKALGGVLFIDEAYSLLDDKQGLYGDEAINTIVQEMENHRDELVVIFAGYSDEMEKFLQRNPGLRSRVSHHVDFPNYDVQELVDITELIVKKKSMSIADDARKELAAIYERAYKQMDFGNGRFARTMVEKAILAQSSRLIREGIEGVGKHELNLIRAEDFEDCSEARKAEVRFGFCA